VSEIGNVRVSYYTVSPQ